MKATEEMIALLKGNHIQGDDLVLQVNQLLGCMDLNEQLGLHRVLSPQAINRLHPVLDKMTIHPHLKEHLVWSYFYHRLSGLDSLSNELMQAMLNEYSQNKFLAVESLFINALKSDIISLKQLEIIEKIFSSKAFIKESAAFKCREIVRAGNKLKPVEITMLIDIKAFKTLDYALDKNAVTDEGLKMFTEPLNSEQDKKSKLSLFRKAQNHLSQ